MLMKRIFLSFSLLVFASCSGNKGGESSVVQDPILGQLSMEQKSFNLLSNNLEIPEECKPPIATEENKRAFVRLRGRVNRCAFFIPQDPRLNNFYEVRDCLNQIGDYFDDVSDQTCKSLVTVPDTVGNIVDVMNTLLRNYYVANVRVVEGNETKFKWENVQDYFSLWGHWFNQTRKSMYQLDAQKVISKAHEEEFEENIHRPFWNDLQAYSEEWRSSFGDIVKEISPTNPDGTPRTPEEIAALRLEENRKFETFKTMLSVNTKVLVKAFESELGDDATVWDDSLGIVGPSPLLASLLGSSLQPFFQRIKTITKVYDVACKLKNCTEEFYENNKTFWLVKFLKGIGDGQGLAALDLDRDDVLNDFIMSMKEREEKLLRITRTLESTFEVSKISTLVPGNDFPRFLANYVDVFAQAYDLLKNYENTKIVDQLGVERAGYFASGKINEVNVGFSKANMDRHIGQVRQINEKLIDLREKFTAQKHTLIQEVLALNSSQIQIDQMEDKINIDLTDIYNLKNQIDSIRFYVRDSRESFAEQVKNIILNQKIGQEQFFTHPQKTFVVDAHDTAVGNTGVIDGAVLANVDADHQFKKGDLLQVQVQGEWSPTCAVSEVYGEDVRLAKTGGKGFTMIESRGRGVVRSVDDYSMKESFTSVSVTASACGGVSVGANSASVCASATAGTRTADGTRTSTVTSNTTRSDASFNIGVTLKNTPYPNIPAGALLLVVMPRGENLKVNHNNLYILGGNDTFVVGNDNMDFYLIGNDCHSVSNTGSLTVQLTRQSSQGQQASRFIDKISSLAQEVQSRVQGLIDSGQLSHQVLQGIKSELLGSVGDDINSFSGPVRQLLDSYITSEIAILDYKSQLTNMERLLESKKQKLLSLLNQFNGESEQRFLRVHTRNWLISNMDLDFVNTGDQNNNLYTLSRVLNILEHSLVSYLDFKYRGEERDSVLGDLTLLSSIDISDNFDTISDKVTTYVRSLLDNIEDDLNNKPLVPQTTVGIRVKNPFYEPSFEHPYPDDSIHPIMNEARAFNFWNKLVNFERFGEAKVDFNIFVEDLYTDYGLSCYTETPIIETMGLFFVPENEGYVTDFNNNYRNNNSKLYIDGPSQVPFENILRSYNFVNFAWRYMDAATRMAISPNHAMKILVDEFPPSHNVETGLGTGRPIFGKFKIGDLKGLRRVGEEVFVGHTPIKEIKELFIGYVISAANYNFDLNLNWIEYCESK